MRGPVIVDTETTGLDAYNDRVVEIACADVQTGEVLLDTLVYTDHPIHPEAHLSHGLTSDMLVGAPRFDEIAVRLSEIISGAEAMVGHNPFFDRVMLASEFRRAGVSLRWPVLVCTKRLWDRHEPPNRTLSKALERFTGRKHEPHRALRDVLATRDVVLAQLSEFNLHNVPWEELDPEQQRWIGPTHHVVRDASGAILVNFGKHEGKTLIEAARDVGYWKWILRSDFPAHVQQIAYHVVHFKRQGDDLVQWVEEVLA